MTFQELPLSHHLGSSSRHSHIPSWPVSSLEKPVSLEFFSMASLFGLAPGWFTYLSRRGLPCTFLLLLLLLPPLGGERRRLVSISHWRVAIKGLCVLLSLFWLGVNIQGIFFPSAFPERDRVSTSFSSSSVLGMVTNRMKGWCRGLIATFFWHTGI